MKSIIFLLLIYLFILPSCSKTDSGKADPVPVKQFYKGADISFLPEIEEAGTLFLNQNGQSEELADMLKSSGVNTIRLRLWHTPANAHSGLNEVSMFVKQLKAKGFKIYISLHYSDTWADPGHQTKPFAWNNLPINILQDSVYIYTRHVVQLLDPDIIEIGNEISNGFLWPEGRISDQANFIALLKKGIQGARDATSGKRKILIHCATLDVSSWFYNIMKDNEVDYDIIGVSYYPFWTKVAPAEAVNELNALGKTFSKDIMISEFAYPFSLGWNDYTNNIIGTHDQLLTGYPATPEGQKLIFTETMKAMEVAGTGLCYWAPDWVAFKGPQSDSGSSWENLTLFDFNNKALPALDAFRNK